MGWKNMRGAPPDYDQCFNEMLMLVDEEIKQRQIDEHWFALNQLSTYAHAARLAKDRMAQSPMVEIIEEIELRGGW